MNRLIMIAMFSMTATAVPAISHAEGPSYGQGGVTVSPAYVPPQPRYRSRPGPRLMAPLRIDIGGIGANSKAGFLPGAELSAGIHWASLSPNPTSVDFGLGVFVGAMGKGEDMPNSNKNENVSYAGLYAEFGKSLSSGDYWRTWASGRAELLEADAFGNQSEGYGVSAKLEAELYLHGVGISPSGLFLGSYALGVYVQAAARHLGDDVNMLQLGAGVTVRTPMVWAW
jgi:hypothetical protein